MLLGLFYILFFFNCLTIQFYPYLQAQFKHKCFYELFWVFLSRWNQFPSFHFAWSSLESMVYTCTPILTTLQGYKFCKAELPLSHSSYLMTVCWIDAEDPSSCLGKWVTGCPPILMPRKQSQILMSMGQMHFLAQGKLFPFSVTCIVYFLLFFNAAITLSSLLGSYFTKK